MSLAALDTSIREIPMPFVRTQKRDRAASDSQLEDFYSIKRRKCQQHPKTIPQRSSPSNFHYPPQFFDKLSKVVLTKGALKELDRRNGLQNQQAHPVRNIRPVTRGHLRNIRALVAQTGGPDLQALRGYPQTLQSIDRSMSSGHSSRSRKRGSVSSSDHMQRTTKTSTTATKETGTSGAYSRNFSQHLIDHGIYPDGYEYPDASAVPLPDDWDEFNRALQADRASLSPSKFSEAKFREFRRADAAVVNEGDAMRKIVPLIQGTKWDERRVQRDVLFGNLAPLTDGTLKNAKPDLYYGARPEELKREIRHDLSKFIVPSSADNLPILPTLFMEAKGPDGSLAVALRQICYDGALGVRGMHELDSYQRIEPLFDNNIKAVSSIYHGGQFKLYAHHMAQPKGPGTQPEIYMNQVNTWGMTGNKHTLVDGLRSFRNVVDWTDRKRTLAISRANGVFHCQDQSQKVGQEKEDGREEREAAKEMRQKQHKSDHGENEHLATSSTRQSRMSFTTPGLASDSYHSSSADDPAQDSDTSVEVPTTEPAVPAKRVTRSRLRSQSKRRARPACFAKSKREAA